MDLADRVVACVEPHPAVRDIRLAGSRARGSATELSDWDFLIDAYDFAAVAEALPNVLAPLRPLAQQWDRLSPEWCWMLTLRGPVKVDLIFPDQPHDHEPPWEPDPRNLGAIDAHFWDWVLWLRSKDARGKTELVAEELRKLYEHLLAPLGVEQPPSSIRDGIARYRDARRRAEQRLGVTVGRELEAAVAPAFEGASARNDVR